MITQPPRHILFIGAHPDDCDFSAGGTAALCRARGDRVKFVSVSNGNKGHFYPEYIADPKKLVARRMEEGRAAAAVIGAEFETLGIPDGEVYVTPEATEAMVRLIRRFGPEQHGPDLVILNRPSDYHRDHRYSAQLVLDATYVLTVPIMCPDTPHLMRMPVFAYWADRFTEGGTFRPDVVIPIDEVLETKIDIAIHHASQLFEWLPYNAGTLDQVPPDPAGRREWTTRRIASRGEGVVERCRAKLEQRLGPNHGVRCAEAFQISEYGRQPSAEELLELFPV
jgi:LmbE family N-acetylglucosaminyl deacetylase